jgi:hypothetical protein
MKAHAAAAGQIGLAAIVSIKATAQSAMTGSAALAARTSIKVAARGVLTGSANLIALMATGTAQVKAFGQMTITAAKLVADPRFLSKMRNRNRRS